MIDIRLDPPSSLFTNTSMSSISAITSSSAKKQMKNKKELQSIVNYFNNFKSCFEATNNDSTKLLICVEIAEKFLDPGVQKVIRNNLKTNKIETHVLLTRLLEHNNKVRSMMQNMEFLKNHRHINEYFRLLKNFATQDIDLGIVYKNMLENVENMIW